MRTPTQIIIAIALALAGYAAWRAAEVQALVADGQAELAVFNYSQPEATLADVADGSTFLRVVPGAGDAIDAAAGTVTAARFWGGDLSALEDEADTRPFAAANASYRQTQREGGPWRQVVGRLDAVVTAYADVLRRQPENADAAFNYELAIRIRDMVASAQVDIAPTPAPAAAGDIPDGRSLHGVMGAPPEASDTKQFKMIVPMRPDERMEAEQAGRSAKKVKKG
ncbi:MAG: hypothetical protein AB7O67_05510 [Vicinamibacterales bacterium]